eukprot:Pgem_evm1s18076
MSFSSTEKKSQEVNYGQFLFQQSLLRKNILQWTWNKKEALILNGDWVIKWRTDFEFDNEDINDVVAA